MEAPPAKTQPAPMESVSTFSGQKIKLTFPDGREYDVEIEIAKMSGTIADLIGDYGSVVTSVPLMKNEITHEVFLKILEYCRHHYVHDKPNPVKEEWMKYLSEYRKKKEMPKIDKIDPWDIEFFVGDLFKNPPSLEDQHERLKYMFQFAIAADYLHIKNLYKACTRIMAKILTGKNPQEMRIVTGFQCDFTPEEEQENMKLWKHFDV